MLTILQQLLIAEKSRVDLSERGSTERQKKHSGLKCMVPVAARIRWLALSCLPCPPCRLAAPPFTAWSKLFRPVLPSCMIARVRELPMPAVPGLDVVFILLLASASTQWCIQAQILLNGGCLQAQNRGFRAGTPQSPALASGTSPLAFGAYIGTTHEGLLPVCFPCSLSCGKVITSSSTSEQPPEPKQHVSPSSPRTAPWSLQPPLRKCKAKHLRTAHAVHAVRTMLCCVTQILDRYHGTATPKPPQHRLAALRELSAPAEQAPRSVILNLEGCASFWFRSAKGCGVLRSTAQHWCRNRGFLSEKFSGQPKWMESCSEAA